MKVLVLVLVLAGGAFALRGELNASPVLNVEKSIYGTWKGTGVRAEIIVINTDKSIGFPDIVPDLKIEIITSVVPHQMYIAGYKDGEFLRKPLAIFKIVGNKLVMAQAIDYSRTMMGIPIGGIVKSEFPKDFSGEITEYEKVESVSGWRQRAVKVENVKDEQLDFSSVPAQN